MADENYAAQVIAKAFQGDAEAQYELGISLIQNGNTDGGVEWVEKAAFNGYADAQNSLGVMYYNGEGVDEDWDQAEEWFQKAALQGHAEAQRNLDMLRG